MDSTKHLAARNMFGTGALSYWSDLPSPEIPDEPEISAPGRRQDQQCLDQPGVGSRAENLADKPRRDRPLRWSRAVEARRVHADGLAYGAILGSNQIKVWNAVRGKTYREHWSDHDQPHANRQHSI